MVAGPGPSLVGDWDHNRPQVLPCRCQRSGFCFSEIPTVSITPHFHSKCLYHILPQGPAGFHNFSTTQRDPLSACETEKTISDGALLCMKGAAPPKNTQGPGPESQTGCLLLGKHSGKIKTVFRKRFKFSPGVPYSQAAVILNDSRSRRDIA